MKLFGNPCRFGRLMIVILIPTQLTLSFLLPEASYLFLAPVFTQSGNGKYALLPFMDLKQHCRSFWY